MKTIKQIADEIGVSKQAVQKRISREPLYTSLRLCISTIKGTKYIDEIGEHLIKLAFIKNVDMDKENDVHIDIVDNQQPNVHTDVHSDIIKILQENITVLQKQLDIKDKQIEELTSTVRTQAESINADRKNELAGTLIDGQRKLLAVDSEHDIPEAAAEPPLKPGFLKRIFSKNK